MYRLNYHHITIKRLILAVAGILALGGCGHTDEPATGGAGDGNVMFGAYVSAPTGTRASVADMRMLKKTGFGVFASQSGNDDFNPDASAGFTPGFMCNQKVGWSPSASDGAWIYEPVKSWTGSKLSFFAYAPYSEGGGETGITGMSGPQDAGSPRLSFRMDSDIDSQTDLLYADASSTVNLVNSGQVQFVFLHALSRIGFSCAADGSIASGTKVTVRKIVFKSSELGVAGDLDLFAGRWVNLEKREIAYTLSAAESDFIKGNNEISSDKATTVSPLTANGKYLMLIPSGDKVAVEISIDYDVTTADDRLEGGNLTVSNNRVTRFDYVFEMGKAYDFTLRIGMDAVVVGVGVTDWDSTESDWKPVEKK